MDHGSHPSVSVVLNTFNRSSLVVRAIESVLSQTAGDLELIVVDDGSNDDTAESVGSISDPRLMYVHQENAGLSVGRNNGANHASGEWIIFLDDDDEVEPEWLEAFHGVLDTGVGIVFSGHKTVNTINGSVIEFLPKPMGAAFGNVTGGFLAGSWIMRRDLFDATGGFLTELPTLVQSELLLRAIPSCYSRGLTVQSIDTTKFLYSVTPGLERPTLTADLAIRAASMILDRHVAAFAADDESRASWNAVIGVAAARSCRWTLARVHFFRAARAQPANLKNWARLVITCCPGRRRVWPTQLNSAGP